MPRRREVPKRKIIPDPKFHDRTLAKFANVLILDIGGIYRMTPPALRFTKLCYLIKMG